MDTYQRESNDKSTKAVGLSGTSNADCMFPLRVVFVFLRRDVSAAKCWYPLGLLEADSRARIFWKCGMCQNVEDRDYDNLVFTMRVGRSVCVEFR